MGKYKFEDYFDPQGKALKKDLDDYFDEDGDFLFEYQGFLESYPSNSDFVRMFYACIFSNQTHGNYCARTLYARAY